MKKKLLVFGFTLIFMGEVNAQKPVNKCEKKFTCPDRSLSQGYGDAITQSSYPVALSTGFYCRYDLSIEFGKYSAGCKEAISSMTHDQRLCSQQIATSLAYIGGGGNFGSWTGTSGSDNSFHFYRAYKLSTGGIDLKKCKVAGESVICNTCLEVAEGDESSISPSSLEDAIKNGVKESGEEGEVEVILPQE
jgi:hypothetical protein